MSDPIADLLTRIRNACMRGHTKLRIPSSKMKQGVLDVFLKEGFIRHWELCEEGKFPELQVSLKYHEGSSVIRHIQRVSKPGLRTYSGVQDLKPVLSGQGILVVTTSKGILSDRECRKQGVGGEVLCRLW